MVRFQRRRRNRGGIGGADCIPPPPLGVRVIPGGGGLVRLGVACAKSSASSSSRFLGPPSTSSGLLVSGLRPTAFGLPRTLSWFIFRSGRKTWRDRLHRFYPATTTRRPGFLFQGCALRPSAYPGLCRGSFFRPGRKTWRDRLCRFYPATTSRRPGHSRWGGFVWLGVACAKSSASSSWLFLGPPSSSSGLARKSERRTPNAERRTPNEKNSSPYGCP